MRLDCKNGALYVDASQPCFYSQKINMASTLTKDYYSPLWTLHLHKDIVALRGATVHLCVYNPGEVGDTAPLRLESQMVGEL